MHLPEIPETATEEYLEKLTEKILNQLEKASNKNVRLRLNTLLQEVQRRKKKLLQEIEETHGDTSQTKGQDPLKMFDTANLTTNEQQQIKERLKYVLEDIKQQRPESQQFSLDVSTPADASDAETSPHALLNTVELTKNEYQIVKERMKEMLFEVQEQRQDRLLEEHLTEEEEEEILLEDEVIPGEELSEEEISFEGGILEEEEIEAEDIILLEDEVLPEEEWIEEEPVLPEDSELEVSIDEQDEELEGVFTFDTVCNKVKAGEPLTLFKHLILTEREQAMIVAFEGYIKQTKGLKRQQVFDIQHLTSRSIRELDQLFKTYHLQGYLSVELHNIYNRLLNLRSRISILLS